MVGTHVLCAGTATHTCLVAARRHRAAPVPHTHAWSAPQRRHRLAAGDEVRYSGVDIARSMIQLARQTYPGDHFEIMRSEQWDALHETFVDEGMRDKEYPWNKVLAASAFGKATGDVRHWWDTHVAFPVQSSGSGGARIKVADIEGTANLSTEDGRFG